MRLPAFTAHGEIGFHVVENRRYVTDIHATVRHQIGIGPKHVRVESAKPIEKILV